MQELVATFAGQTMSDKLGADFIGAHETVAGEDSGWFSIFEGSVDQLTDVTVKDVSVSRQ